MSEIVNFGKYVFRVFGSPVGYGMFPDFLRSYEKKISEFATVENIGG